MMAMCRLNVPSVFIYGGSILPGNHNGVSLDITSVFEAVGACAAGTITEDELEHGEKEVQTLTDQYIKKIDDHLHHKEKEIMTV